MNATPAPSPAAIAAVETPDVVVIGGGPAGLAAATVLREAGVAKVVVLERQVEAGGIPRACGHSPFGMREFRRVLGGKAYAKRLVEAVLAAGVDLRLRHSVVSIAPGPVLTVVTPDGVRTFVPKRVIIATGIRETTRAARLISGDRPIGVMNTGALQDMVELRGRTPFKRPVIVGTELVSMSAILTCRAAGAKPVAVVEAAAGPIIRWPLCLLPRTLGIPLHLSTTVAAIHGVKTVEAVTLRHGEGRETTVECDGVVLTGRFTPESSLARIGGLAIDPRSGGPSVDQNGRTGDPAIFAAGNVLRGVETAGWCWAEGRSVGREVAADLGKAAERKAGIAVEASDGVKLVMPQRLDAGAFGASGLPALQVRLDAPFQGRLVVEADGRAIWSKRIDSGPERRLLVPLGDLAMPSTTTTLRVVARA